MSTPPPSSTDAPAPHRTNAELSAQQDELIEQQLKEAKASEDAVRNMMNHTNNILNKIQEITTREPDEKEREARLAKKREERAQRRAERKAKRLAKEQEKWERKAEQYRHEAEELMGEANDDDDGEHSDDQSDDASSSPPPQQPPPSQPPPDDVVMGEMDHGDDIGQSDANVPMAFPPTSASFPSVVPPSTTYVPYQPQSFPPTSEQSSEPAPSSTAWYQGPPAPAPHTGDEPASSSQPPPGMMTYGQVPHPGYAYPSYPGAYPYPYGQVPYPGAYPYHPHYPPPQGPYGIPHTECLVGPAENGVGTQPVVVEPNESRSSEDASAVAHGRSKADWRAWQANNYRGPNTAGSGSGASTTSSNGVMYPTIPNRSGGGDDANGGSGSSPMSSSQYPRV